MVAGERPHSDEAGTPWFVRVLLGTGGWLGAIFLLGFVSVGFRFVVDSAPGSFFTGAVVCLGAALLFRVAGNSQFLPNFGFALSLAGQGLMAWGLARGLEPKAWLIAVAIAAQQGVLFFIIPNALHRVWTAATASYALAYALGELGLASYAPALLTAAVAWIWLREFDAAKWGTAWRCAGYGLAVAAALAGFMGDEGLLAWLTGHHGVSQASRWPGLVLGGAVLVWAAIMLLGREQVGMGSGAGRGALLIAAVLALAAVKAPGLAPAVAILVIGFANGNRLLAAFGIAALLGYLSHYYYSLHATLLEKSLLLALAGGTLLLVRLFVNHNWPQHRVEAPHA